MGSWIFCVAAAFLAPCAQGDKNRDLPPPPAGPDAQQVEAAIQKGAAYLKNKLHQLAPFKNDTKKGPEMQGDELVLWALLSAGVPEKDPAFQKLFTAMMSRKLEATYCVSLQAVILEAMDREKYQRKIQQCGQFLVDNQLKNGSWAYGEPSKFVQDVSIEELPGRTYDLSAPVYDRPKPKVARKLPVRKMQEGTFKGEPDNSNSQFAALGLRACHDAGIVIPPDVVALAIKWWRQTQHEGRSDARGGWCYSFPGHGHHVGPYGSMAAGGVASMCILDSMLGGKSPWKRDPIVLNGVDWMTRHFSVTENPGPPEYGNHKTAWMYYYYLYALSRAGLLFGEEKFGPHEWYRMGAEVLLGAQQSNGSWIHPSASNDNPLYDTCFAILFLRRATRPLEDPAPPVKAARK